MSWCDALGTLPGVRVAQVLSNLCNRICRTLITAIPCCSTPQKKLNINDWSAVQDSFDELQKKLDKFQKNTGGLGVPASYVRVLVELEDAVQKTFDDKELKKKMSATNAKSFNTMRQRVKKHNANYTEQIAKFRENPVEDDDDDEDAESESSEEEQAQEQEEEDRQAGRWRLASRERVPRLCCAAAAAAMPGLRYAAPVMYLSSDISSDIQ
jgi:hypothetical protein